jgi:hypothetical protein
MILIPDHNCCKSRGNQVKRLLRFSSLSSSIHHKLWTLMFIEGRVTTQTLPLLEKLRDAWVSTAFSKGAFAFHLVVWLKSPYPRVVSGELM